MLRSASSRPLLVGLLMALMAQLPSKSLAGPPVERATAEVLFSDARKLASEGRFVEACPKFEESNRLDPGVGTLLYLAECYEKTARLASAWITFREAAELARSTRQPGREKVAIERASALDARLPRLLIEFEQKGAGIKVLRDGVELSSAIVGTASPLDQGPHTLVASAPGKKSWTTTVELKEGATVKVVIPTLVDESPAPPASAASTAPPAPPPSAAPSASVSLAPTAPAPPAPGPSRTTLAVVAGGVGLLGVGIGSYFGLRAQDLWDQSRSNCKGTRCGYEGTEKANRANNAATASTVSFLIGAAGLGAGAALLLWPSSSGSTALRVGPGSVSLEGNW